MLPLFHAIGHGVKGGHVQEAFDEIFRRRIERGRDDYINRVFGAFGADLAAIGQFFEIPWTKPFRSLSASKRSWLVDSAAHAMTALRRLRESVAPREAGLAMDIELRNWFNAAVAGGTLSDTLITLGDVARAILVAERALIYADRSDDIQRRENNLSYLAAALADAGDLERAAALFAEAETLQADLQPDMPQLYSLQGYLYGDLLLARGAAEEALTRSRTQLDLAQRYLGRGGGLHNIGFGWLLIGRAQDALGEAEGSASLDTAVEGLRNSGTEQYLPQALLARAAHRRKRVAAGETSLLVDLRDDLAEVEDIADPEMRLYLADLALERARLALDVPASVRGPEDEAVHQTQIAADLIAATGYHRRDGELRELEARLAARPRAA
jgi:hypothetical protein